MVLRLKTWESRSPPDLKRTNKHCSLNELPHGAGWSSPVARQAHNLKVVGSNPTPATNILPRFNFPLENYQQHILVWFDEWMYLDYRARCRRQTISLRLFLSE
jgi:hypothetical protein